MRGSRDREQGMGKVAKEPEESKEMTLEQPEVVLQKVYRKNDGQCRNLCRLIQK